MLRRRRSIGSYPATRSMETANMACKEIYGKPLRDYLLSWRADHPNDPWDVLADEFGIHIASLYRWFDRLRLRTGGPVLIDLDAERAADAVSAAAAAVAETEGDAPRTGSDG